MCWKKYSPIGVEARTPDSCRTPDVLQSLADLPQARIIASANISAPLMLLTHHVTMTGPYHRSPDAMADGLIPFTRDEASLRDALDRTQADFLLLCRDAKYWKNSSFATALSQGTVAEGLVPVDGVHEELVLLRVVRP